MRITGLKVFLVNPGGQTSWGAGNRKNWIFVKIYTDEGIEGVGEAFGSAKDKTMEAALYEYERWLKGQDPTKIIYNWQAIYRGARYPLGTETLAALSAVEQALWDITGKAYGVPVYKLLGGPCRDRIRLYAGVLRLTGKSLAEGARKAVEEGFSALKPNVHPDDYWTMDSYSLWAESVERVRLTREAIGDTVDLCLECHGISLSPTDGIRLAKALEPYHPMFIEEPALSENPESLLEVKHKTTIPIAAGERAVTRESVREILEKGAVHVLQPEPCANGGILETVKISAMAEMYHIQIAPHHACSAVSLMTCAHIDACVPNFLIQECNVFDSECARVLFTGGPVIKDGYLLLSDAPGLGIELNEEAAAAYPYRPFDRRVVINQDGSVGLT